MADYIEREAAIARVKKQMNREFTFGPWAWNDRIANVCYGIVIEALERLPSADAKPVVRGKWIDMGDFEQCSVCKGTHLKEFQSMYGKVTWVRTDFCPNCGADMREVDNETA